MRRAISLIAILAATAALTSCGSGSESGAGTAAGACAQDWPTTIVVGDSQFTPVVVSADLGVGTTEFTLGLLDRDQNSLGGPDTAVDVKFYDLDRSEDVAADGGPAHFFWAIPDVRGMYSVPVDLDAAGTWGAEVSVHPPGAAAMCEKVRFSVQDEPRAPAVGAPAPRSVTRTAADAVGADLATITSDADPDPSLYRYSLAELLDAGRPFVVAFSTPKFCTSRTCGPTVDQIKQIAPRYPGCAFVHVEIFQDVDKAVPEVYVPAVTEWNLPSEPWVFVVDADGKVAARFEGAMSDQSLRTALDAVCPGAPG